MWCGAHTMQCRSWSLLRGLNRFWKSEDCILGSLSFSLRLLFKLTSRIWNHLGCQSWFQITNNPFILVVPMEGNSLVILLWASTRGSVLISLLFGWGGMRLFLGILCFIYWILWLTNKMTDFLAQLDARSVELFTLIFGSILCFIDKKNEKKTSRVSYLGANYPLICFKVL